MKPHLQCAEQQVFTINLTNTAPVTPERLTYLVLITYETSFTVRGATGVTINLTKYCACHRKMTRLLYRLHIWNVISNARSNRCHNPTSPNTAPATKNDTARFQRKSPKTDETSFPMRGRSEAWSDHDPTMIRPWKRKPQPASQVRLLFELTTSIFYWKIQRFAPNLTFKPSPNYCACHVKCHLNFTKYCACHAERLTYLVLIAYETSFTVRGATGVTIQPHQILRLPRKMTRLLYRPHIWNVISNARSNRCHYPTSPNTAPATKNDTARFQRKSPKTGETSFPMRGRSEHDPSMIRAWSDHEKNANRNPPRKWGYFSSSPRAFSIEKYNVSRPILHSNLHQILRLPRKVPLELHQILRLPRKVTLELHQVLRLPRKVTLELHQVLRRPLYGNWTLLYSTLLDTTLRDTTLRDTTLRDTTLLDSTLLDSTLLDSTWHYSTWHYSTWHYSTWHYSTWHYSTWLYSTWLYSTWLYLTLLYVTLLYLAPILLDSTLLDLLHLT